MTTYRYTAAAEDFVATADSRETSREIMRAIVAFAKDTAEAVTIWEEGLTNWDDESKLAFINTVTSDGLDEPGAFCWGSSGSAWAREDVGELLVLCQSADGWSLHAPGSTDEAIASGDAPYLLTGEGRPGGADYAHAWQLLAARR